MPASPRANRRTNQGGNDKVRGVLLHSLWERVRTGDWRLRVVVAPLAAGRSLAAPYADQLVSGVYPDSLDRPNVGSFSLQLLGICVGNLIATGIVRSADRSGSTALFVTGAALMLLNSAFVIGIGVLMFPILRPTTRP